MPLYEYQCAACAARVEKIQKLSDPPPEPCPSCGKGPMVKQLSSPAIQFKGSGWYITDYARKGGSPDAGAKGDKPQTAEKTGTTPDATATPATASTPPAPAAASKPSES